MEPPANDTYRRMHTYAIAHEKLYIKRLIELLRFNTVINMLSKKLQMITAE